jgi:hypothetical protein
MTRSRRVFRVVSRSLLALTIGSTIAYAQVRQPPHTQVPMSYRTWLQLRSDPARMSQLLSRPAPVMSQAPALSGVVIGPWQSLTNPLPGGNAANPLLLTDGNVIVHIDSTRSWWQLTPDINGSYVNGTWSQIASLPPGYEPRFFASQILSDGRVIINGGEDNSGAIGVWTNLGAIYDPLLNVWNPVNPPPGWQSIGDAQSVVLDDGTYLLANALTREQALLTGFDSTFTWTATGTGKADGNDEENWSLLPDGNVLTVNAYIDATCDTGSELYDDERGTWVSAGSTIVQLPDCSGNRSFEVGPQLLRPDGTVIAFGGTTTGSAHTAILDSSTGTWTVGPDVPSIGGTPYTLADAPSALLPSGNVLFAASPSNWPAATGPGAFPNPTHFFEIDLTNNITQVTDNPDGVNLNSFEWNFLVLPTGQVLATETDTSNIWIYTPSGSPNPTWKPVIYAWPAVVRSGSATYRLTGIQFNGLSEGVSYGDDVQAATNFPIVKIVNDATGNVFYQRTFGFTRSLASGREAGTSTEFTVTATTQKGASSLYVIANGIASDPVPVVVQ